MGESTDPDITGWARIMVHGQAVNPVVIESLVLMAGDNPSLLHANRHELATYTAEFLLRDEDTARRRCPQLMMSIDSAGYPSEDVRPEVNFAERVNLVTDILGALYPAGGRIVPGSAEAEALDFYPR